MSDKRKRQPLSRYDPAKPRWPGSMSGEVVHNPDDQINAFAGKLYQEGYPVVDPPEQFTPKRNMQGWFDMAEAKAFGLLDLQEYIRMKQMVEAQEQMMMKKGIMPAPNSMLSMRGR